MVKKNKGKKKKNRAPKPETKEVTQEEPQITLNVGELRGIAEIMIQGASNIETLPPQQARSKLMKESWELTQLLITKEVRECRQKVNNQLLTFFQNFPEALEPIKKQVFPTNDSEE